MASSHDSLSDIFGPNSDGDSGQKRNTEGAVCDDAKPDAKSNSGTGTAALKADDFDDIFGDNNNVVTPSVDTTRQATAGKSPESPDFDDIFGSSSPTDTPSTKSAQTEAHNILSAGTGTAGSGSAGTNDGAGGDGGDKGANSSNLLASGKEAGDKAFLDFLYEDDASTANTTGLQVNDGTLEKPAHVHDQALVAASAVTSAPDSSQGFFAGDIAQQSGRSESTSANSSLMLASTETEDPALPAAEQRRAPPRDDFSSSAASSALHLVAVSLASPESDDHKTLNGSDASPDGVTGNQSAVSTSFSVSRAPPPPRPLPADPGRALRELVFQQTDETGLDEDGETAAADDLGYVRRLCAATGGFLSPDLRPAVWGLLLGIGRTPDDAGFRKWRDAAKSSLREGEGEDDSDANGITQPSAKSPAISVPNKLDLRNDSLALARRLRSGSHSSSDGVRVSDSGGGVLTEAEALATDIEEVLTFYCSRRSEAYEPVLSALVGPLFLLGLEASAVSAMLYPLVGALTLFLGRGLTHAVRDLAWVHAHRRLHDLCTYHDPQLVQHLDRCFPGWELPLPAASVSRAETSALDQQAAAMVDDLESSLPSSVRRPSSARGNPAEAFTGQEDGEGDDGGGVGGACGRGSGAEGQSKGLIEPSLLVAANAGLGASVPLTKLLPLWDYLLVRRDKHFGFFLLLAALLRRRDNLLQATGPQLRRLLAEILSLEGLASAGFGSEENADTGAEKVGGVCFEGEEGDRDGTEALALWCREAEALDLATPESFRHHLALIGEIAEAEHEAALRAKARNSAVGTPGTPGAPPPSPLPTTDEIESDANESGDGVGATKQQLDGDSSAPKGLNHPSLLRMRVMMKTAGDKIAADLKSLKLARSSSGSRESAAGDGVAPPPELSLPQLCLAVGAKELLSKLPSTRVGNHAEAGVAEGDELGGGEVEEGVDGEREHGELFRERKPLSFFAVDCRPKEQVAAGRLPKAYHLDPSSLENPEDMAETIMSVLEPLRGRAHLCLVGSGDGHIRARGLSDRDEGSGRLGGRGGGKDKDKDGGDGLGSQRATRDEYSYVNTCALFFMKRGFPYVSVLEGGYAAAHELVMDTLSLQDGTSADENALSTTIVDHNPAACRLCLARNSSAQRNASTGGGGGGIILPPPMWVRLGAADLSTHGDDAAAGKNGSKHGTSSTSKVQDAVTNAFFRPPRDNDKGGSTAGKSLKVSAGKFSGEDGGGVSAVQEGRVGGGGTASDRGIVGEGGDGEGGLFIKGSSMFRGMNIINMEGVNVNVNRMSASVNSLFNGSSTLRTEWSGSSSKNNNTVTSSVDNKTVGTAAAAVAMTTDTSTSSSTAPANGSKDTSSATAESKPTAPNEQSRQATAADGSGSAPDLAAKFRMSFGRFAAGRDAKKDGAVGGGSGGGGFGDGSKDTSRRESSGLGSLFRKAQSLKPADVAAAFADLRDGPKNSPFVVTSSMTAAAAASAAATANPSPMNAPNTGANLRTQPPVYGSVEIEEEEEDDGGGLFVIGDDGSEASETPDSDFEGFDGEHRPPSAGGVRSEADKAVALLEHRLSGQVKGATMVVDDFLKVPGAKIFTVTKHKVIFHEIDAGPPEEKPEERSEVPSAEQCLVAADVDTDDSADKQSGDSSHQFAEASTSAVQQDSEPDNGSDTGLETVPSADPQSSSPTPTAVVGKKITVRAVTELERLVFLSRERVLVLACPDGPRSPGLVKSNHHLTELQKMTFMRKDPTLVTLHYLAGVEDGREAVGGDVVLATKRNVYRFDLDDKEAFIRIIRGALQRFQA